MVVQWFPGHMAKTLKDTRERLKLVDMVIEICDARIPRSSQNPSIDEIISDKSRLLVLNKADLADGKYNKVWIDYFESMDIKAVYTNGMDKNSVRKITEACSVICAEKIKNAKAKGARIRPVRAMVVGIPNTGKSSIINSLAGRKVAMTSDKPGVTRSPQWVRAGDQIELMDMPGVLWPKIESKEGQILIASTGAVKDTVLDTTEIAYETMKIIYKLYPEFLALRYKVEFSEKFDYELFEQAAKKRGCIRSGGKIDIDRFSNIFLDEFRAGIIGAMTFERPE